MTEEEKLRLVRRKYYQACRNRWLGATAVTSVCAVWIFVKWDDSSWVTWIGIFLLMLSEVILMQASEYHSCVRNLSQEFINTCATNRKQLVLRMLFGLPFALCLRDFRFERQRGDPVPSPAGPLFPRGDYMLEQIVKDLQPLRVYSAAQPEMLFPDRAVSWVYLSHSEWEAKVRLYMTYASLIVILVDGLTPGIRQEIRLAADPVCRKKTLLLIAKSALERLDMSIVTGIRWRVELQDGNMLSRRPRQGVAKLPEEVRTYVQNLPKKGTRVLKTHSLNDFDSPEVLDFCENELLSKPIPLDSGIVAVDVSGRKISWMNASEIDKNRQYKTVSFD